MADYGFGTTIEGRSDLVQINVLWLSNCLGWKDSLVDVVKQLRLFFPLLVLSLDKLVIKDLLKAFVVVRQGTSVCYLEIFDGSFEEGLLITGQV